MTPHRRATLHDIPRLLEIREAVQENRLSVPGSVTAQDCAGFVDRDLFWVAVDGDRIVGFSACDDRSGTIWALFVDPTHQGLGLGAQLLALACRDLADAGYRIARLTTDPGTRADRFYRRHGWRALGLTSDGELQFERPL